MAIGPVGDRVRSIVARSRPPGFANVEHSCTALGVRRRPSACRGGPDWVPSGGLHRFDAVAERRAADAATMSGPMLRRSARTAFRLKAAHRDRADSGVCADGGPRRSQDEGRDAARSRTRHPLQPRRGGGSQRQSGYGAPQPRGGATRRDHRRPLRFCRSINGPNLLFVGAGTGVPALGGILGAPVIDRTGIPDTVRFNYVLEFAPDERTAGPLARALLARQ